MFLQGLLLQHLHEDVSNVVSVQPSLPVSIGWYSLSSLQRCLYGCVPAIISTHISKEWISTIISTCIYNKWISTLISTCVSRKWTSTIISTCISMEYISTTSLQRYLYWNVSTYTIKTWNIFTTYSWIYDLIYTSKTWDIYILVTITWITIIIYCTLIQVHWILCNQSNYK